MKVHFIGRSTQDFDYEKHVQKIQEIKQQRDHRNRDIEQYKNISHKLQKARQISREFRNKQTQIRRTQSDYKMVKAIQNMPSMIKTRQTKSSLKTKPITRYETQSKASSIRKYLVECDNRRLEQAIKSMGTNVKEYKKKIVTEIGQYVKLRQHMQRYKQNKSHGQGQEIKTQRCEATTSQADFRKFLAKSIEKTKNKMAQRRVQTEIATYRQ